VKHLKQILIVEFKHTKVVNQELQSEEETNRQYNVQTTNNKKNKTMTNKNYTTNQR
jgi:hypothetical protein